MAAGVQMRSSGFFRFMLSGDTGVALRQAAR